MTMNDNDTRAERLKAFIRQIWDEGNAEAAADYIAPAYTIHHDPTDHWEGQTLDLEGFKTRIVQSRAAFPDQCFDIQGTFTNDDGVIVTWLWRATHLGDIPGFAATGKTITMSGATAYFFDDNDRLTGHWQIRDSLGVYQQLQRNKAA
jgi:predicted ester cyclase